MNLPDPTLSSPYKYKKESLTLLTCVVARCSHTNSTNSKGNKLTASIYLSSLLTQLLTIWPSLKRIKISLYHSEIQCLLAFLNKACFKWKNLKYICFATSPHNRSTKHSAVALCGSDNSPFKLMRRRTLWSKK